MTDPILRDFPFPILTPRLRLQPRFVGEGPLLHAAVTESQKHLSPWMDWAKEPWTLEAAETHCRRAHAEFILRKNFALSIYSRETGELVGSSGYHDPNWNVPSLQVGYWIRARDEGKGYITEAVNALTRYAFEVVGVKRLEIRCDGDNSRSLAVMLRLGFKQDGVLRSDVRDVHGKLRDTIITSRLDAAGLSPLEVSWP